MLAFVTKHLHEQIGATVYDPRLLTKFRNRVDHSQHLYDAGDALDGMAMIEQGTVFRKPVTVGDTVHPEFEIEDVWQDDKQHSFCRFKTELLNHKDELLVEGFHVYRIMGKRAAND